MRCQASCSGCDKPSPGPSAWAVILRSRAGTVVRRKAKKVWPSGHRTSGTKSARISPARGMEGVSCPFSFLHILLLGSIGGVGFFHNPLGFLLYQERRSFVPAQVPDGLTSLSPLSVPPGPASLTANRLSQPYHTLPLPCSSYLSTHAKHAKKTSQMGGLFLLYSWFDCPARQRNMAVRTPDQRDAGPVPVSGIMRCNPRCSGCPAGCPRCRSCLRHHALSGFLLRV